MKKMKKLLAMLVAMVMVLAMAMPAMAADENYALTIQSSDGNDSHKFVAYQIFQGTVSSDGETLSDVNWGTGVNTNTTVGDDSGIKSLMDAIIGLEVDGDKPFEALNTSSTAADVAKVLGTYEDNKKVVEAFAKTVESYLSNVYTSAKPTDQSGTYVISDLKAGYYLVQDQAEEVGDLKPSDLLLKIVYSTTINAKVDNATVTKTAGAEGTDDNTSYGVGDSIPYTLTGTLPADFDADETEPYLYKIVDTMDPALELECAIDQSTAGKETQTITKDITVSIDDIDVTNAFSITKSVNENGKTVLEIACENIRAIDAVSLTNESKIVVSYRAILKEMPEGEDGVSNTVKLTYDTNTSTTDVTEKVFPLTLKIKKQDGIEETPLAGAEFQLSRVTIVNGVEEIYYLSNNTGTIAWSTDKDNAVTLTTNGDGQINVAGIPAGTYKLKETKAPDGYNILSDEIELVIDASITTSETTGLQVLDTLGIKVDGVLGDADKDTGTVTATIANNKGATLPSTGGIGTTIFYIIGGVIVVGAVVLLVTRRRMNAER